MQDELAKKRVYIIYYTLLYIIIINYILYYILLLLLLYIIIYMIYYKLYDIIINIIKHLTPLRALGWIRGLARSVHQLQVSITKGPLNTKDCSFEVLGNIILYYIFTIGYNYIYKIMLYYI